MPGFQRTYRMVDGERIEGTWRHAFIKNGGTYFLTDLLIYADGKVDCWELLDFDQFCAKVRSGWVATSITPGSQASAHHVATWRMDDPQATLTPDELIGEVVDEIAKLRDEPTSSMKCRGALDAYVAAPSPDLLEKLREAYFAVPRHLRRYLGDMDSKDTPIRVLLTPVGQPCLGLENARPPLNRPVSEEHHQAALSQLAEQAQAAAPEAIARLRDPERPPGQRDVIRYSPKYGVVRTGSTAPTVELNQPTSWLSPGSPHPVTDGTDTWPTVLHAYCAASVADPAVAAAIRVTETRREVLNLARHAPKRENWPQVRLAEMARLLRLKFAQHPDLVARLLATEDAILQTGSVTYSEFWDSHGQNWTGRLLEIIRAELALAQ